MGISAKRLFGIITLALGLVMLLNGVGEYKKDTDFEKNSETVTAAITRVDTKLGRKFGKSTKYYTTFVTYEVEDKVYEDVKLDRRTSSSSRGSSVDILYSKDNPEDIRRKSSFSPARGIYTSFIFLGLGIFFVIISLGDKKKKKFRANKKHELRDTGTKHVAKVVDIIHHTQVNYKGTHPYIVKCVVVDEVSGIEKTYISDYVTVDLSSIDLQTVNVYVSKENERFYFVDVEGSVE